MTKEYAEPITEKDIEDVANKWVKLTLENLKKAIAENTPSQ